MTMRQRRTILYLVNLYVAVLIGIPFVIWSQYAPTWLRWIDVIPEVLQTVIKAIALAWLLLASIIAIVCEMKLERAVEQTNGMMCMYCGYDVRACENDRCAECGRSFELRELQRYWRRKPPWWKGFWHK